MRTVAALSILLSLTLSSCSWLRPDLVSTRPVQIPFDLPSHLRQCAAQLGVSDPEAVKTVGQLMIAYGQERTARLELKACHEEIVRLIDVHNEQVKP